MQLSDDAKSGGATKRSKSKKRIKKNHAAEKEVKSSEESSEESSDDDCPNIYLVDDISSYDFRRSRKSAYESESEDEFEKEYVFFSKMDLRERENLGVPSRRVSNLGNLSKGRQTKIGDKICVRE
ncbi:hypothetical protein TNCV_130581 [Trichonephila clavipes]|nr:hypothetical protein TNCV_130581 [Trichonephila clavipes]